MVTGMVRSRVVVEIKKDKFHVRISVRERITLTFYLNLNLSLTQTLTRNQKLPDRLPELQSYLYSYPCLSI